MKCPRCSAPITTAPDEAGFLLCAQCGARLRTKTAGVVKVQAAGEPRPRPEPEAPQGDIDSVLARLEGPPPPPSPRQSPSATLPPGTPLKKIPRPEDRGASAPKAAATVVPTAYLDALLEEIRVVRRTQEQILSLLRSRPSNGSETAADAPTLVDSDFEGFQGDSFDPVDLLPDPGPVRGSGRKKSVLLIDDDAADRAALVAALEQAHVPVKTAVDGNGGLAAIAMEKPDVIVLELGLNGSMGGKDVINMIKATMEWVDIPIVLHTRVAVASQKEARLEHGADEFISKGAGSTQALVNKVVALFRRA